jgi:hypothetical protein
MTTTPPNEKHRENKPVKEWHRTAAKEVAFYSLDHRGKQPEIKTISHLIANTEPQSSPPPLLPREVEEDIRLLKLHSGHGSRVHRVCTALESAHQQLAKVTREREETVAWTDKAKKYLNILTCVDKPTWQAFNTENIVKDAGRLLVEATYFTLLAHDAKLTEEVRRKTLLEAISKCETIMDGALVICELHRLAAEPGEKKKENP